MSEVYDLTDAEQPVAQLIASGGPHPAVGSTFDLRPESLGDRFVSSVPCATASGGHFGSGLSRGFRTPPRSRDLGSRFGREMPALDRHYISLSGLTTLEGRGWFGQ